MFICLFVSTVYSPLLLYTVVVFLRRMLAFLFNLCVVHFFMSINDDDDDDDLTVVKLTVDIARHSRTLFRHETSEVVAMNELPPGNSSLSHCQTATYQPVCLTDFHLHTLVECPELQDIRQRYSSASSSENSFESTGNQNISDFMKGTHFAVDCSVSINQSINQSIIIFNVA